MFIVKTLQEYILYPEYYLDETVHAGNHEGGAVVALHMIQLNVLTLRKDKKK